MYALSRKRDEEPRYEAGTVVPESVGGAPESKKESDPDDSQEQPTAMIAARSSKSFDRMSNEMEPAAAAKPSASEMEAMAAETPNMNEQKLVESPSVSSGNARGTPTIGAVAVPGINAARRVSSFNSDANDTYSYTNHSVEARSEVRGTTGGSTTPNREEPIEATRVVDAEADIEAQVQTRMQNQAKDIAQLVHRELMTNAAVPVDVQTSAQDTASVKDHSDDEGDAKKKKICIIAIILLAIIAAVGAGVGVAVSKQENEPPTTPLTPRAKAFQAILEQVSGDSLKDNTSPQYQAMNWLANTDPANLTVSVDSENTIKIRYVAAVLYYSFHGDDWHKKYNFLSEHDICTWNQNSVDGLEPFGISCGTGDMVESFRSPANNLKGKIPPEITYLSNLKLIDVLNNTIDGKLSNLLHLSRLERLDFANNAFTGTLPEFLLTHEQLSLLDLDNNRLEGTISQLAGTAPNLKYLWLRDNLVAGQIPATIGQSTVLQSIDLDSNRLSGTIPEFTNRSTIVHLLVGNNKLNGTIPTTIGSLSALQNLNLYANDLMGTVPTELGNCRKITDVYFSDNALNGNISAVIDVLPSSLEWLDVDRNLLEGTIPVSVGNLTKLTSLRLQNNNIGGVVPSELGLLTELVVLDLAYNEFVGLIPSTLSNLSNLADFRIQGNNLNGNLDFFCNNNFEFLVANTCSDPDKIECACCTDCCDLGATYCELV